MHMRSRGGLTEAMTTETFLEWLTRRKEERGVSWRQLAREARVGHGTLDNYRRNPDAVPELPTLTKLAIWAGESLEDVQRRVKIDPSPLPRTPAVFRQRADRIVARRPKLRRLLNELLNAPDVDTTTISSMLDKLEYDVGLR